MENEKEGDSIACDGNRLCVSLSPSTLLSNICLFQSGREREIGFWNLGSNLLLADVDDKAVNAGLLSLCKGAFPAKFLLLCYALETRSNYSLKIMV